MIGISTGVNRRSHYAADSCSRGIAAYPAFFYGVLISVSGFAIYILGVIIRLFRISWIRIVRKIN